MCGEEEKEEGKYEVRQVLDRLVRQASVSIAAQRRKLRLDQHLHPRRRENMVRRERQGNSGSLSPGGEQDDGFIDELLERRNNMALRRARGGAQQRVEHGRAARRVRRRQQLLHNLLTRLL